MKTNAMKRRSAIILTVASAATVLLPRQSKAAPAVNVATPELIIALAAIETCLPLIALCKRGRDLDMAFNATQSL